MAREYGKIEHGFWTGETGREMRGNPWQVRMVAAYLMSCGSASMVGIYYLPLQLMVHEIGCGLTIDGASKALQRLGELDFANYDADQEMVWVPNLARVQVARTLRMGDKQRAGILAKLQELRKCPFVRDFYALYRDAYCLPDCPDDVAQKQEPMKALQSPLQARAQSTERRDQDPPPLSTGTGWQAAPKPHASAAEQMSGYRLVARFGILRAEVFPECLPWNTARDSNGDAHSFAQMLAPEELEDIDATMRLALEHIRAGAEGWKHPRMKDPSFAFGAWKSGFHGLREELHGARPATRSGSTGHARPEGAGSFAQTGDVKL